MPFYVPLAVRPYTELRVASKNGPTVTTHSSLLHRLFRLESMEYSLLAPRKICFGWGRRTQVGELGRSLGRRAWIVCGSRTLERDGTLAEICERLEEAGVDSQLLATVTREPEVEDVDSAAARLLEAGVRQGDFVVGLGGGAGMDTAKAVAALATNRQGQTVQDYLEGVGVGLTIDHEPLPTLMMPTTAGTGSEATKNAVISSYDPPFKKSLRSERMVPDAVLVDPELTVSCPPSVTAHSGMDAITQLIESAVSCRANPYTSALCASGLQEVWTFGEEPAVIRAWSDPADQAARTTMSHAALMSGIALANSGLGMAHGVAAALGVHCRVPHGLACATLLPIAMQANASVVASMYGVAVWLTTGPEHSDDVNGCADAEHIRLAIEEIRRVNARLGIPATLGELGVSEDQLPAIVASSHGNSMNGNPRKIGDDELATLLQANL